MLNNNDIELLNYKITRINMDFERLSRGENKISLSTSIRLLLPKDTSDNDCAIEINISYKDIGDNVVFSVLSRWFFSITVSANDEDARSELLKSKGVEIAYEKLRNTIDSIWKITNIDFMNIPPYDEINK